MIFWLVVLLLVFLLYFLYINKISLDWKTLFKKGFPKKDDLFGVYCYEAPQGEGKTYSAIKSTLDFYLKFDYQIITNLKSFHDLNKDIEMLYISDIFQLIDFVKNNNNRYVILFDEIFTVLQKNIKNPRGHEIMEFLAQLRKRKIIFISTAQNWSQIPKEFRDFCRYKVHCHMFNFPLFNCAITWNTMFDGYNVKWNDEIQDFEGPLLATKIGKANLQIAQAYDTFETIKTNYGQKK